jgi:hypothetical protein
MEQHRVSAKRPTDPHLPIILIFVMPEFINPPILSLYSEI